MHPDLPPELCREAIDGFPEVSEGEVVRHFTRLSKLNVLSSMNRTSTAKDTASPARAKPVFTEVVRNSRRVVVCMN